MSVCMYVLGTYELDLLDHLGFKPVVAAATWGAPSLNQEEHSHFWGSHTLAFITDRGPLCLLRFSTGTTTLDSVRGAALNHCGILQQRLRHGEIQEACAFVRAISRLDVRHQCLRLTCDYLFISITRADQQEDHTPTHRDSTRFRPISVYLDPCSTSSIPCTKLLHLSLAFIILLCYYTNVWSNVYSAQHELMMPIISLTSYAYRLCSTRYVPGLCITIMPLWHTWHN